MPPTKKNSGKATKKTAKPAAKKNTTKKSSKAALNSTKLNVGCGRNILDGWINLDIAKLDGVDIVADLENCAKKKLPLGNDSIEEFLLSHVIEHINNPLDLMQELHRIAKPDAKMVIRTPYGASNDAYEDPTHCKPYFEGSFGYFSQPYYWRADYGYRGDWQLEQIIMTVEKARFQTKTPHEVYALIRSQRNIVIEMIAELKAVKPIREPKKELQTPPNLKIITV